MPPMKITSGHGNDQPKFGVVVSSIADVKRQALSKLGLVGSQILVQLEDGTIVEDEAYFKCLEPQTVLIVTTVGESSRSCDSVDSAIHSDYTVELPSVSDSERIAQLTMRLHRDINSILQFTTAELQLISNADPTDLGNRLHMSDDEVDRVQFACHTHLVEREKTSDALNFIDFYRKT